MISTWAVLLLCAVGALSVERELFGKLPHKPWPRPSVNIYNGNKTSIAKYPYIASLQLFGGEYGTAVILNKNWLLTAGWNVAWHSKDALTFRVGSSFYDKQGQVLKASKVVVHPKYTGYGYVNDIAVVKTNKPIIFGKKVKAVKLATKSLKSGTKAWIAGWGYNSTFDVPENLLEAQVTVCGWNECRKYYGDNVSKRCFCTFDKKVAPCSNDCGDPLVVDGVLYGIFVGEYSCEPPLAPMVYTDVASYYKWIQDAIKSEEDDQE